jgi:hypothetical protein
MGGVSYAAANASGGQTEGAPRMASDGKGLLNLQARAES